MGKQHALPGPDLAGEGAAPTLATPNGRPSTAAHGTGRPHVVVLGAGVCGLYAARTLAGRGARVTVLEKAEIVGGLAGGRERNGNHYDFGVHQLHAFDAAIFEDIRALMGDRLIPTQKAALIRYGDGYRRYPLEFFDLLTGIPAWTLARAMAGLVAQQVVNRLRPGPPPANAEEALIQLYGRPLYGFFFRDFTHRYWGIPPAELSAAFVRSKMPRLSAVDVVKKALSRFGVKDDAGTAVESALRDETLWYSRTGAREMPMALADAIAARGGEVRLNATVTAVVVDAQRTDDGARRIRAVRYVDGDGAGHEIACDACLSTIPVSALVRALGDDAPADVRTAGAALRHKAVAVYGLLVKKPRVLDAQYVYYRDRIFHRIAEPSNSGMEVQPAGHTVVLVETTCDVGDDRWNGGDATRQRIVADMQAEGLLAPEDIVEWHHFADAHAYPVFDLGFELHLARIEAHLAAFTNLRSTGRQGAFCFPNMHGAMRMGADTAVSMLAALDAAGVPGDAPAAADTPAGDGSRVPSPAALGEPAVVPQPAAPAALP